MSIVRLVLIGYLNDNIEIILWTNPAPCSYMWCRPFRLLYKKELEVFVQNVFDDVQKEITELQPGNLNGLSGQWFLFQFENYFILKLSFEQSFSVQYKMLLTMIFSIFDLFWAFEFLGSYTQFFDYFFRTLWPILYKN